MAPPAHMQRLRGVDAAFLAQESQGTHMHVGAVAIFDGAPPTRQDLLAHVRGRLPLVPRYRQRVAEPAGGLGRPRWVDDPDFNLEYHVRQTALPRPGDELVLRRLSARIFSQALDRTKPLWELWLAEGLSKGRFAVITKTHQAMVDGVIGADLMAFLFDDSEEAGEPAVADTWTPRPMPSAVELAAAELTDVTREAATLPARAAWRLASPARALAGVRRAVGTVGTAVLGPSAPETPLDVRTGPHRRVAFAPASLDDFRAIRDGLGGTVNDAVLAVVAGALQRFLHRRGVRTQGLDVRAGVPISRQGDDDTGPGASSMTQLVVELPVSVNDPVRRLTAIRLALATVKQSEQALGASEIAATEDFAPPNLLAAASRLDPSSRRYNILVTNVPGPQRPLYLLGRRMRAVFPVSFLPRGRALAVACVSYDGAINFGLIADYDAVPDIEVLVAGLEEALAELREAATPARRPRRRAKGGPAKAPRGKASAAKAATPKAPTRKATTGKAATRRRSSAARSPKQ